MVKYILKKHLVENEEQVGNRVDKRSISTTRQSGQSGQSDVEPVHDETHTGDVADPPDTYQTPGMRQQVMLFAILAVIYLLIALSQVTIHPPGVGGGSHFMLMANGWLHGRLYIVGTPPGLSDFTYYKGHWYVAFPPLPAVLMLPLVAIFHLSYQSQVTLFFSVGMGILNILLMQLVLHRLVRRSLLDGSLATTAWLLVFFALGTELLYVTMKGSVWFVAHVVATTFLLLYMYEMLGKQRAWLAALLLGCASLSRSATLFAFPFFLLWTYVQGKHRLFVVLRQWILFSGVLGMVVGAMLLYNYARFDSFFDFGYSDMSVNPLVGNALHTYGQFSVHFLAINTRYMLLQPPKFLSKFPYVTFNPFGTSIFLTMPALLFAVQGFRRRIQWGFAAALLAGSVLPIATVLLYFNTGWYQFGYRFALDFLPFLFLLAALGMARRSGWLEKTLIVLSVLVNVWGYIVFTYFRPPLLG